MLGALAVLGLTFFRPLGPQAARRGDADTPGPTESVASEAAGYPTDIDTQNRRREADERVKLPDPFMKKSKNAGAPPLKPTAPPVPVRRPAPECPLGWEELTQMTGEEGPSARYIRSRAGELQRVEALYRGSVVTAVTKVDGGFRVTVANEFAVADFTSRPWFTPLETDGLIEAYSEYVAKVPGSGAEKIVGRFRVQIEPDPQLPIRPSFVVRGAD